MKRKQISAIVAFWAFAVGLLSLGGCVKTDDFNSLKNEVSRLEDSLAVIRESHKPIYIEFDVENSETTASEGDTLTVNYTLSGAVTQNTVLTASTDGFYKVRINKTSDTQGSISIICPEVYTDGYINVMVSDGKGYADIKVIRICRRVMDFPDGLEYKISGAGSSLTIPFATNFGYSVKVTTTDETGDISWINIGGETDTKVTIREESISLQVAENKDYRPRNATISFIPDNGSGLTYVEIKIIQRPAEKYTFTVNGVSFDMVLVEEGIFDMFDSEEEASYGAQRVLLTDYYIGATEVTQELWQAVMGKNPSSFKKANAPVEQVNWYDCINFTERLGEICGLDLRLPTEAQWEFAARGGNKSKGYTYSGSDVLDEVAWYKDNSGGKTHEVATKKPNELGIYDMTGNVSEWCYDLYGWYAVPFEESLEEALDDYPICVDIIRPENRCEDYGIRGTELPLYYWDRCLRGGSYGQSGKYLRVINMGCSTPTTAYYRNGFRLALPLYPVPLPPTPNEGDIPLF